MHLRLAIYDELAKVKNDETIETVSIYTAIDNLEEVCPKIGHLNERDTRHQDYKLLVTKDLVNRDSFLYRIYYENRTGKKIKNWSVEMDIYDISGQYRIKYYAECNGNDGINNLDIQVEKEVLVPREISLLNLKSNVDYFRIKDIFKYSRFDLKKLKVEYVNEPTKEYRL